MEEKRTPIIFDTSDGQQLRINTIGSWLRRRFHRKTVKLSLDGGFTCPNRDGTKGTGGCLFCSSSGSGDMASLIRPKKAGPVPSPGAAPASAPSGSMPALARPGKAGPASSIGAGPASAPSGSMSASARPGWGIGAALQEQVQLISDKWPDAGFIAYFQNHTNTYAPADHLRELFYAALDADTDAVTGRNTEIVGLAIATRPDCISEETLDLLEELDQRTFLWVELGLQTIHDETARAMNLCHSLADYDDALRRLTQRGIRVVTHLILGLPGESREMMLNSVRYVCQPLPGACADQHLFGLKLHMLNVVRGSGMELAYPDYVPFASIDEYTDLLIECLELVPPDITIHRIGGDAPRSTLIAPEWSYRKRTILNEIHRKMRERNTWQGRLAECAVRNAQIRDPE